MALRPALVDGESPFLGESCALCKKPFEEGDLLAICPDDATRHHSHCWEANDNKCTAYGCAGNGRLRGRPRTKFPKTELVTSEASPTKIHTLPARSFHCAQSCLLIAIAVAIVLFSIGCFGLWAIFDYVVINVFGWQYREPLTFITTNLPFAITALVVVVPYWAVREEKSARSLRRASNL
jgi:hypothetical protein